MKRITIGMTAHVDAGKTTLSEAILYQSGEIRSLGRVDKGNTFLDTFEIEKKRGITIFSKQAVAHFGNGEYTLLDPTERAYFSALVEYSFGKRGFSRIDMGGHSNGNSFHLIFLI